VFCSDLIQTLSISVKVIFPLLRTMAFIYKLLGENKQSTLFHYICQFLIRANKEAGTGSLFLIQIRIRKRELVPYSLFRFEKGTEVFCSDLIHTFLIIVEVIAPLFITAAFI
jgi:hypothetical protein